MSDGETLYPFEFVLQGVPISLQAANPKTREAWKGQVKEAARNRQRETYESGFLDVHGDLKAEASIENIEFLLTAVEEALKAATA